MKFDREAPGEGAEAICSLENGKAILEWRFYFEEESESGTGAEKSETSAGAEESENGTGAEESETGTGAGKSGIGAGAKEAESCARAGQDADGSRFKCGSEKTARYGEMVRMMLTDMRGNAVLEGIQPLHEEEPLRSVLLQPHLWSGTKDPYLYRLEAVLTDWRGNCLDRISRSLPLRSLSETGEAGRFSLNGEPFERRAVAYTPPCALSDAERQRRLTEDLERIRRLGANCVLTEGGDGPGRSFLHLCDRLGLLLFCREKREAGYAYFAGGEAVIRISTGEKIPVFRGEKDCFFRQGSDIPTSLFYRHLAKWSREPFVYIIPESVKRLESGNYFVRCYSNCARIALYSDGVLFEFQRGEEEFTFLEVPARTPCIMLTAEGDGCSASLSLSKMAYL